MNEKVIGVVGGVGPFAGLDLQRKIAEQTLAGKDQDHVTVLSVSRPSPLTRTCKKPKFIPPFIIRSTASNHVAL